MSATNPRARGEQIAADIRAQIMSGRLVVGAKLPSTRQLGEQYAAATATIQAALDILKAEGYLTGLAGKGVYVEREQPFVVDAAAYLTPTPGGWSYRLISVAEVTAPPKVAAALGVGDELVILRHRMMLHGGEPVELSWSYYPAKLARGTDLGRKARITGGAPRVLAELGHPMRNLEDLLTSRAPSEAEVAALNLPTGVPVLCQFRIIRDGSGAAVEVSELVKGAHLYGLRYRVSIE